MHVYIQCGQKCPINLRAEQAQQWDLNKGWPLRTKQTRANNENGVGQFKLSTLYFLQSSRMKFILPLSIIIFILCTKLILEVINLPLYDTIYTVFEHTMSYVLCYTHKSHVIYKLCICIYRHMHNAVIQVLKTHAINAHLPL